MIPILRKISIRKLMNEKGKNTCIVVATFLMTILFTTLFSAAFFLRAVTDEMARGSGSWVGDAAFIVTDEEAELIAESRLVSDVTFGLHIGEILDEGGYIDTELVFYEEKMAHWMKCYPVGGRMPERGYEVVLSENYLEDHHLEYKENSPIQITYSVDGEEFTDTFIMVGYYEWERHNKNVMLFSSDFYAEIGRRLQEKGKESKDVMYKTIEVIYRDFGNAKDITDELMAEIGFDESHGYIVNDSMGADKEMKSGIFVATVIMGLFVIIIGYLFISNVFSISMERNIRYYGKLATNGVTGKEIAKIIFLEMQILFFIAVIPAVVFGYLFSYYLLPGILYSFFTVQVDNSNNILIFISAAAFSWITLMISAGKSIHLAKIISPMEMKRYMKVLKDAKKSDNRCWQKKFTVKKFLNNKRKVFKIYFSIAFSILLANLFYTIVAGFDEQEYISKNMPTDYIVATQSFYSQMDARNRENITTDSLNDCFDLPGMIRSGGGGVCGINIILDDRQTKEYEAAVGDNNLNHPEPGNMYTNIYGLDDIMVDKMEVIEGEIDLDQYHTGNYVIVNSLTDEGRTCFHIGDSITVPFQNGNVKTYTILAIAELPFEISYQSKWMGSADLFLPYAEWSNCTGINEYYMYIYDVEKQYRTMWDQTLSTIISKNTEMTYRSAQTLADSSRKLIKEIKTAGFLICAILVFIGIMNFINCMANSVYSRKRELAVMQSMGVLKSEIIWSFVKEGIYYMTGGELLGIVLSVPCTYWAIEGFLNLYSIHYSSYLAVYVAFLIIGLITAFAVPSVSYLYLDKKEPFLERIRSCRE